MNLSNYDSVIFDMDGVITTEKMYWRIAALTVAELLCGYENLKDSDELYNCVFKNENTIKLIKNLGVNTNFDLAYVVYCVSLSVNPDLKVITAEHFHKVYEKVRECKTPAPMLYDECCLGAMKATGKPESELKRGSSPLWTKLVEIFQLWYLGTENCNNKYSKTVTEHRDGMSKADKYPAIPVKELVDTLKFLKSRGLKLGIGTGRPISEALAPLELWGVYDYFEKDMICTYTEVEAAEKALGLKTTLTKPHPFVFLKALFGEKYSDRDLAEGNYDKEAPSRSLAVGDAAADLLAAKSGGFPFLGVLTGVDGEAAKKFFEENGADYILSSIAEMRD